MFSKDAHHFDAYQTQVYLFFELLIFRRNKFSSQIDGRLLQIEH